MTQPPDDPHPMPWQPGAGDAPRSEDQPSVAWAPQPAADTPTPSGWVQPGALAAAPLVGWELPAPAPDAPANEGFVVAGMGARIVAYLIDLVLVSMVPTLLALAVTDFAGMFGAAFDAQLSGNSTQITVPVTTEIVLVTLISVAVQYFYFVGFWTSRGRATPGMRGLKMQVVDVGTGQGLSITGATIRWAALGAPLALLSLIRPLQAAAGLVNACLLVILFLTTVTNDRRQGLHDRWAGSLVIRSTTSGDGATVAGIVVLVLLWIGFAIIFGVAAFIFLAPQLPEILSRLGRPT